MTTPLESPQQHHTTLDARTHYLYRLFNDAGDLLYVGITCDLGARFAEHKRHQPWWDEKAHYTVETATTRADVLYLEARAILTEHPRYNRDIPSLARFDVLRGRATIAEAEGLTAEERIEILEYQLRQAKTGVDSQYRTRVTAQAAQLMEYEQIIAELQAHNSVRDSEEVAKARKVSEDLLDAVNYWKDLAQTKEAPKLFIVEGPRTVAPISPPEPAAPRRGFLRRLRDAL